MHFFLENAEEKYIKMKNQNKTAPDRGIYFPKSPRKNGGISIYISRMRVLQWAIQLNFAHFTLFLYIL